MRLIRTPCCGALPTPDIWPKEVKGHTTDCRCGILLLIHGIGPDGILIAVDAHKVWTAELIRDGRIKSAEDVSWGSVEIQT